PGRDRRRRLLRRLPAGREPPPPARDLRPDRAALAPGRADLDPDRGRARGHPRRARRDPGRRLDPGRPGRLATRAPRARSKRALGMTSSPERLVPILTTW